MFMIIESEDTMAVLICTLHTLRSKLLSRRMGNINSSESALDIRKFMTENQIYQMGHFCGIQEYLNTLNVGYVPQ